MSAGPIGRWSLDGPRTRLALAGDPARRLLGRDRGSITLKALAGRLGSGNAPAGLAALLDRPPGLAPLQLELLDPDGRPAVLAFSVLREHPRRGGLVELSESGPATVLPGDGSEDDRLAADLRGAAERGELALRYQPVIDLERRRPWSVEVLLRWHHPSLGLLRPGRVVALAETAGVMNDLSSWIVATAVRELTPLLDRQAGLKVAFNLSAASLTPAAIGRLVEALGPLSPRRVVLELVETLLDDSAAVGAALAAARNAGMRLALDDFGTGISSLGCLDRHPLDLVKLDAGLMARLLREPGGMRVPEAVLSMTDSLGLRAVALGIETADQLAWLISRGCRYGQGLLLAPSLDARDVAQAIETFEFSESALAAASWSAPIARPRLVEESDAQALRLFVRELPAAVAMFDTSRRYVVASDRWIEQYGLDETRLAGQRHDELLSAVPARWEGMLQRSLRGAAESGEDELFTRPDGTREWVRWETRPFHNRFGDVAGVLVFSEFVGARREAERQRRASEGQLAAYLEIASDWIWETDAQMRFTSHSLGAGGVAPLGRLLGRTRWGYAGVDRPEDDPLWAPHKADLDARRPFRNFVFPRLTRDGGRIWLESSGDPVFDEDGTFKGYRGTGRDVTARVLAQEQIHRQAEQLRLASEIAGVGYWETDLETGLVHWSQELFSITGRDPDTFRPTVQNRHRIYHPDDIARVTACIDRATAGLQSYEFQARVLRPDGTLRHIVSRGRVDADSSGRAMRVFGTFMDVTAQVEARLALEERGRENAIYRAMIEALPDLVFAMDGEGRFVAANQATAQYLGAPGVEALVGRGFGDFMPAGDAARLHGDGRPVLEQGDTIITEEQMRLPDGSLVWLCSLRAPLRDGQGRIVGHVGHSRDISLEKQAQAEIDRLKRDAEQAHDMLREATGVMDAGFAVFDRDDRLVMCNGVFARTYGEPPAELEGKSFAALQTMPAFRARLDLKGLDFDTWLERRLAKHRAADGRSYENWVGEEAFLVRERRTQSGFIVLLRAHVTDLKRVEAELRRRNDELAVVAVELERSMAEAERSRDLLQVATSVMMDGFALFDPADRLVLCNEPYAASFERSSEEVIGRRFVELLRLEEFSRRIDTKGRDFESWLEWRLARHHEASGEPFEAWLDDKVYYVRERRTADGSILAVRAEITELKRVEQELRRLATTDTLTGAHNRRHFVEQGERLLARSLESGVPAALLLIDLDRFKRINDAFGHEGGDEALRSVSRLCRSLAGERDLFARWGGEEFIMLLPDTAEAAAQRAAERIRAAVAALVVTCSFGTFGMTASLGWAVTPCGPCSLDDLVRRADSALYLAKAAGRNQVMAAA